MNLFLSPEMLSWLAECQRNRYVVVPIPENVRAGLRRSPEAWTRGISYLDHELEYEPRSLAFSPDGTRIAIGTKAGRIHLARWNGVDWAMEEEPFDIAPGEAAPETERPLGKAVRGLCFLGPDLLVAGGGPGLFTVLDLAGQGRVGSTIQNPIRPHSEDPWLLRFTKILPLFPGSAVPTEPGDTLALGITQGRFLHVLRRGKDGQFEATFAIAEDLLRTPRRTPRWEEVWIIDGEWWEGRLWLLDSSSWIHCLRPNTGPGGFESGSMESFPSYPVPYFRPRNDPRSISLCRSGIGVCVGEDVTFLPFRALEEGTVGSAQWIAVPGAIRCIAVQEFGTEDRAYLAVATSDAGMRWIPGRLLSSGVWQASKHDRQQPLSGSARDPILEMSLVRMAHLPDQVYLVLSTRGHRLRIASLLDRNVVDGQLKAGIKQALEDPAKLGALLDRTAQPGMAVRLLRSLIDLKREMAYRAFGDEESGPPAFDLLARNEARLFDALGLSDLPDVLRQLGRSWRASYRRDQSAEVEDKLPLPTRRAEVYRWFCLLAFQRAARLDERSLRGLAHVVLAAIEDLRRDLAPEEWRDLGLFGGFLRKWFLYGYTYGEKREHLLQLAEWNRSCGRDLDAIFYLTRVLRWRLDGSWSRPVEPTGVDPTVWDLAATDATSFLLHSHTDGRIFATSQDGRPVRWVLQEAGVLKRGAIVTCDAGLALCHREAESFRKDYRHGPYARSLYLGELETELKTERSFLVVFGIRGWHPIDFKNEDREGERPRLPRLVALAVEWSDEEGEPRLLIREAAICILDFEPYAIVRLPARGEDRYGLGFIVGTGGGSGSPFIEMRILLGEGGEVSSPIEGHAASLHTSGLGMIWHRPVIEEDPRWRAIPLFQDPLAQDPSTRFFSQGSNPCWTAQALQVRPQDGGVGEVWLWIGMQDGRVRPFLWDAATGKWLEGGPRHRNDNEDDREIRPVLDPILTYSPLRKLRVLEPPGGSGPDGLLLAYGNAAGVVGVVPLGQLSEARAERASWERPLPEWNEPWIHLIHTREKRAICGLADYQDGGDWNLAVLTESGRIAIFNLQHQQTESRRVEGRGFIHRGLRLDYFLLSSANARALFAASGPEPGGWKVLRNEKGLDLVGDEDQEKQENLPFLIIGGEDGTIRRHILAFPKFSPRRNGRAVPRILNLFRRQVEGPGYDPVIPVPYLVRCLGKEEDIHYWLRLCDVRDKNLLRFSLWYELQDLYHKHFPPFELSGDVVQTVGDLAGKARTYTEKLLSLAAEVYGRKPFDTQAAKILWSETAGYANKVAGLGVNHSGVRGTALKAYSGLLAEMDNLCNRWIGAGQPEEAKVLMHSFSDLFDWPGIVLLALDDPGEDLQEARKLLLFHAVQRRLRHNDLLVPLEAIRIINTAILRAIVKHRQYPEWVFAHRPQSGGFGFYDLLTLVSNLVRQQAGRLTPSDPLYTEISKLLALSLLLVPDGIFAVGRLVSASRLAEHETDVGRRILRHARMFQDQLDQDFGIPLDEPAFVQSVRRFEDYLSREVDLTIDRAVGEAGAHPWQRLMSDPSDKDAPPLTDSHYLSEQQQVFLTVARLARLQSEPSDKEVFSWLGDEPKYFQESREYLSHLRSQREQLLERSKAPLANEPPSRICDRELRDLDEWPTLVEPQRSHYRSIIEQWRRELDQRGQQAIDLVKLIDRFNRHVYRTSADDLMASLMELALRSAPLAFPPIGEGPLRLEIRDQVRSFPFVSELFRRGTLLVQGSHLAEALLYLATECLKPEKAPGGALFSWQYKLSEIKKKAKEIADLEGVELNFIPQNTREVSVPGDEFVWSTILRELARNVYDYCTTPNGGKAEICIVWCEGPATDDGQMWFLAVGGNRSFYDALREEPRRELGTSPDPEALLRKVRNILKEPGVRYHTEPRGSFGFGLYFLHRLFELLGGAGADLLLFDPERLPSAVQGLRPGDRVPQPEDGLETLPLTMIFSWIAPP